MPSAMVPALAGTIVHYWPVRRLGERSAFVVESTWLDIVTRFVIPPLLGGAGGLITIYAQWGIEQQRQKLQARRDLISGWRKALIPLLNANPETTVAGGSYKYAFMYDEGYASLRPHLRPEVVRQLEGQTIQIVLDGPAFPRTLIIEEIGRIEKEWRLV